MNLADHIKQKRNKSYKTKRNKHMTNREKTILTQDEFMDQYGDVKVIFKSYDKYTFTFGGEFNGKTIYVNVGGDSSEIYRFDVSAGKEEIIRYLGVNHGEVKIGNKTIAEFSI
jgi:glutamine cyclotransferase